MFGTVGENINSIKDVTLYEFNGLFSITLFIIFFGINPMPIIDALYLSLAYTLK